MKLKIIVLFIMLRMPLAHCQNLDLDMRYAAGKFQGMAGSGIALAEGSAALDLNPAGLDDTPDFFLSNSQSLHNHIYSLYRNNEGVGAINFDWQRGQYNFDHILLAFPVNAWMSLGGGLIQKLNPYLNNRRHAITWSSLFEQNTNGHIYAVVATAGVRIFPHLSWGISGYRYVGAVTSKISGENHGIDDGKWAKLTSNLTGINCRTGVLWKMKKLSTGFILDIPYTMKVKVNKSASPDQLYAYLLPQYDHTTWHQPLTLGLGVAYEDIEKITFTLDIEHQNWKTSSVQLNLYEFGTPPHWKDRTIVRTGIEVYPLRRKNIPLRFGYAYVPQFYASNKTIAYGENIIQAEEMMQNIKHRYTTGTSVQFSKLTINLALAYATVQWQRDMNSRMLVHDDFKETTLVLAVEFIFCHKHEL